MPFLRTLQHSLLFSLRYSIKYCAFSSLFFIYNSPVIAKNIPQKVASCPVPVHENISTANNIDLSNTNKVFITSDRASIQKDAIAKFSGNVTLANKEQKITAETLSFNQATNNFKASGEIHYQTPKINVTANDINSINKGSTTSLNNTSYQLTDSLGHGSAGAIIVNKKGKLSLIDASFTTCFDETPAWQLNASAINISTDKNFGEAYNARFNVMGVPVFYLPYFTFPVTNERKSGFLYPSISSSSNRGLVVETPYYWNIAPNVDATITPRIMTKRGTQLLTELRYLKGQQSGEIHIEYLDHDRKHTDDDKRYLLRFQHEGSFSDNFRAYIDTTTMSDDAYLTDINSKHYNDNDAYLYQTGEIAYFSDYWNLTTRIQNFEIIGDHTDSYKTVPQIEFNSKIPLNLGNASFDINSELTAFKNRDPSLPEAERYHAEAILSLPFGSPAWFINSEFKILQTEFRQSNLSENSPLDKNVSRTIPKIRLHAGMNFDRNMRFDGYTQTFEPQVQYLYIPFRDQSNIGRYDTTLLQDDYTGLFRDRNYSGLDFIAEADQYSWGVTTRILNAQNNEKFRLSFGRILSVDKNKDPLQPSAKQGRQSALAIESLFQIDKEWQVSSKIQYDTKNKQTNKSQVGIDYHKKDKFNIQLNHRYIRNVSDVSLEQLSLLTNVKFNNQWKMVSRVVHDLGSKNRSLAELINDVPKRKRSLESYLGIQYDSCCWAVRLAYHRHIESNIKQDLLNNENHNEFNSGFMLQFVFNGLNGQNASLDSEDMLSNSIFGYKRPYFLNN